MAISGFGTSLSGMKTAQAQLDLIGRNVANVDTPGYTRKTAQQINQVLAGSSVGVQLGKVTRQVDEGLLKSYLAANSLTSSLSSKNTYLAKTETLLGTPTGNNSISSNVASLQMAFDTFANDVTSPSSRYNLLNNAQTVTARLNSISTEIQKLRGDADVQISGNVDEINSLLDDLHRLNDEIVKYNLMGYDGLADLQDQRDQALRDLSGKIDISYFKRETGELVIQTKGGVTLLDSEPHKLSHSSIAQASPTTDYASGGIGGIYVDGKDITNQIKDGEMKGLIDVRDEILPSLQSQLDELAGSLKDTINQMHNQGTAFPNTPDMLTGTRTFIGGGVNQNIQIEGGDVRFTIFDKDGKQVATTTLVGELGFNNGSVADMAQEVQDWLQSANGANLPQARAYVDTDGKLVIDTGDSDYGFSIRDEANSTPGSAQQDVKIRFDANGNGVYDRSFDGFSNFFGMNDFFVDRNNESIYDSKVMGLNANLGLRDQTTWSFSDSTKGLNYGTVTISPNDSLQDIVNKINSEPNLNGSVRASLVPNGSGYMLRISSMSGEQLEISENVAPGAAPSNLIEKMGLVPSNANTAQTIDVREELKTGPELIAGGSPQFNQSTGEYVLSPAANDIANQMAKAFTQSMNFKQSGTIAQTQTTLANYASTFVGNIASQVSTTGESMTYQQELTNSISLKEAKISGVDIDEELGQMIIFQQTYAACAQAFTANKELLDMLLNLV